jgi:O-antigen/teichoic acid export membrane protein
MPRPTAWRSIWHESAPFAISAGLGVLLVRQDLLLLAWLRGEVEAGVYSVAFKFAEMALYLSMVGLVALVPIVAALHADPRQLRLAYLTALKAATTVAFPLAILVFVNREFLITFLFADAYAAAVPLLAVLSVLMGIYVVHAPSMAMLLAGTRRRPLVVVPVAAIAVSLLINLILIPFLGSMGAAIAALSAMTIAAGLAMRYALRSVGLTALETLRVVSPPGVLGATMLALFLAFSAGRVSELIATPIGLCIYLGIAYAVDTRMSGGSLFERLTGRSGATIAERGR